MEKKVWLLLLCMLFTSSVDLIYPAAALVHDPAQKLITLSDESTSLTLILSYDHRCVVQQLLVKSRPLLGDEGVSSKLTDGTTQWDSRSLQKSPVIRLRGETVRIGPFQLGPVEETWELVHSPGQISIAIKRNYRSAASFADAGVPQFHFNRITDWDGAMLGNGGVAWFKLFDTPQATFGVHVDKITLWNQEKNIGLRIKADSKSNIAVRLSRRPDQSLVCSFSAGDQERKYKYDEDTHRRRYLTDRQDVWSDFEVSPGIATVNYTLTALDYQAEYGRGRLAYFDNEATNALLNTVARIGVIDSRLHGSNSWRTPYGPVCLHEQWIALLASAIADDDYIKAYQNTLSFYRDHAIETNGRVKSRWAYNCEDAMAGTCDSLGFYEAQWGYLLDSNPDFVINVAELFDLCGDLDWVRSFKASCEKVLKFMLDRDQDGDHLVEMMTSDHSQARGSDWIDIIWASHENGFINVEMYRALTLWAEIEELLGDPVKAAYYRNYGNRLKTSFNQTTKDGGLWDEENQCYVHWRDKDDSIHGRNMVVPVNFMAIAYGLCDDPKRQQAILDRIEQQTQNENLFAWPICLDSYAKGEGLDWQFPFPNYENGDLFLGWGQVGVAAYAAYNPVIAVKYVEKLLAQYRRDGLAFQRYLRKTQAGAGDDILANNAMTLVGLYRNIYGIQPRYNRLYLEPHLTPSLDHTRVHYRHRGKLYLVDLSVNDYSISYDNHVVHGSTPFALHAEKSELCYFHGNHDKVSLKITNPQQTPLQIDVLEWQAGQKMAWMETDLQGGSQLAHTVSQLLPNTIYRVSANGQERQIFKSDAKGEFRFQGSGKQKVKYEISIQN